jgi:hypothetical protein
MVKINTYFEDLDEATALTTEETRRNSRYILLCNKCRKVPISNE